MAYGELKVDSITFTDGGSDTTVSVSGLVKNPTFSGNIVVSGSISGITITGDSAGFGSVTGVTVTGTTANFVTVSGATVTGDTGNFTSVSATTATITSGVFASGTAAAPSVSVGTTDNGLYSPGTDEVAISTNGTGRLFVDASGNVGVGATSPTHQLTVHNVSYTGGTVEANRFSVRDNYGIATGLGNGFISPSSNNLAIVTNSEERMRIDSSGRLGLGTSSPDSELSIGNANANYRIDFGDERAYVGYDTVYGSTGALYLDGGGSSNKDIILQPVSTGNVGIGTTSPDTLLTVVDSNPGASANLLRLRNTGTTTGTEAALVFSTNTSTAGGTASSVIRSSALNTGGDTALTFATATTGVSSERARIDSSGRLLVGTSSEITSNTNYVIQSVATGGGSIALARNDGTVGVNESLGRITFYGNDGGSYEPVAQIECEADDPHSSGDKPGRLVFSTTADGSASPTERMRITSDAYVRLASGTGGIQFNGDTAAANALDDYEEGTFTPAYEPETNSFTSVTYQDQAGSYTKIGNRVFFQGRIRTSAITVGTASGNVSISGLPFTSVNDSANGRNAGSISFASGFGGDTPSALAVEINATKFFLYYRATSNGPTAALDVSDLATGATSNALFFSGCYAVA